MNISPSEKDFIDIHSHLGDKENNVFRILNTSTIDFTYLSEDQPLSVGLHPWHINDSAIETLPRILPDSLKLPQVKAVGETGLDRLIKINMEKQEEVFIIHIKYALEYNKPLIIHCVRAYSELIRLKNKFGSKIKWIIHWYDFVYAPGIWMCNGFGSYKRSYFSLKIIQNHGDTENMEK